MSQPTAMPLNLPKDVQDPNDQNKVKESAVLTIMLGKDDHVYYYEGMDPTKIQSSTFKAIRDVVIDKKRRTDPSDFVVILKPTQDATYGNVVNIVDEMKIDDVKRFAQVDISPVEYSLIQKTEQANGAH
jgi:biopolymer transport protein ExbD